MTLSDFIERVELGIAKIKRFDPYLKNIVLLVDRKTFNNVIAEFVDNLAVKQAKADVKIQVPQILGLSVYIIDTVSYTHLTLPTN